MVMAAGKKMLELYFDVVSPYTWIEFEVLWVLLMTKVNVSARRFVSDLDLHGMDRPGQARPRIDTCG